MEAYDILSQIIVNLPVKSLLRFQSVSKSWNAIISDNELKNTDIDLSKLVSCPKTKKLILSHMNDGVFEFRDFQNPRIAMGKQLFPLKRFRNPSALCLSDCLVLMKTPIDDIEYALWNPCTNEYRTFVCPYSNGMTPHGCGLCYDSGDGEYKVILIFASFYVVYYVKRNYWMKKTIVVSGEIALDERSKECSPGITVKGCVYWSLGSSRISQLVDRDSTIIYFDDMTLRELPKPYFIRRNQLFRLTSFKGLVGLYDGNGLFGVITRELDIYVMNQGYWTHLVRINCQTADFGHQFVSNIILLGCTRNGEILFQAGEKLERLVIYDPKRRNFESLKIQNVT